jgi:thiaminase/transcriptional activator TenA
MIDFSYGLFGRLRAAAKKDWDAYTNHEFVRQLGAGTLPPACFKRFLTQDYLFLIHFARAYALLAFKHTELPDIRAATAGLQAIVNEIPLHVKFCASWGIPEAQMQAEAEAAETMLYTRFVLDTGMSGDALDLLTALLPCVAGYGEIGTRLLSSPETKLDGNPYKDWILAYQSEEYQESVAAAIHTLDELGQKRGAETRFTALTHIFATATRLEADFWSMGMKAREN